MGRLRDRRDVRRARRARPCAPAPPAPRIEGLVDLQRPALIRDGSGAAQVIIMEVVGVVASAAHDAHATALSPERMVCRYTTPSTLELSFSNSPPPTYVRSSLVLPFRLTCR